MTLQKILAQLSNEMNVEFNELITENKLNLRTLRKELFRNNIKSMIISVNFKEPINLIFPSICCNNENNYFLILSKEDESLILKDANNKTFSINQKDFSEKFKNQILLIGNESIDSKKIFSSYGKILKYSKTLLILSQLIGILYLIV